MRCRFIKLLSSYIDKELNKEKEARLKEHLVKCAACREELDVLMRTKEMFAKRKSLKVSADFTEKTIASLPDKTNGILEKVNTWIDDIFPLTRRLVTVPLALLLIMIFFLATHFQTFTPVTIEDVLLENNFTQEEILIFSDSSLSSEVALELLIGT